LSALLKMVLKMAVVFENGEQVRGVVGAGDVFAVDVVLGDAFVGHHERGVDVAKPALLIPVGDVDVCGFVVDDDRLRYGGCGERGVVVVIGAVFERWCDDVKGTLDSHGEKSMKRLLANVRAFGRERDAGERKPAMAF